jgi:hypothetical protein
MASSGMMNEILSLGIDGIFCNPETAYEQKNESQRCLEIIDFGRMIARGKNPVTSSNPSLTSWKHLSQ